MPTQNNSRRRFLKSVTAGTLGAIVAPDLFSPFEDETAEKNIKKRVSL